MLVDTVCDKLFEGNLRYVLWVMVDAGQGDGCL